MSLKDELEKQVKQIFRSAWDERDGTVVPSDTSIALSNQAVKINATVLYADLADSTVLVDTYEPWAAAEIYKTFLLSAAKIIRQEGGEITAYDGDRIMAVFLDRRKNTNAVKSALKIKYAVNEIIMPVRRAQYPGGDYVLKYVVGIDTSPLFVAKTGVRGANDLVWVGRAANYAAKLSSLPASYTYITADVYNVMLDEAKFKNGTQVNMWEPVTWNTFDNSTIYRSSWQRSFS